MFSQGKLYSKFDFKGTTDLDKSWWAGKHENK